LKKNVYEIWVIAARYEKALLVRHQIQSRRARIHIRHVQFVLVRKALPDADCGGATGTSNQNTHTWFP
jgi:hypothetical protein